MPRRKIRHLGHGNSNHMSSFTVDGITDTLCGWAKRLGCTYHVLYKRICIQGRTPEDAIRYGSRRLNRTYVTVGDETHTIAEWGRITGISEGLISERLKRGWHPNEAVGFAERVDTRAVAITFHGKMRRIGEWASELGLNYEAMRQRVLRYKAGLMPKRAVFTKGNINYWRKIRRGKYQNWYRGKRITIGEICRRKKCGRSWVCAMYRRGYTATQILDNPTLVPCRDQTEISKRQAEAQRRNRHLRQLKQMGLIV